MRFVLCAAFLVLTAVPSPAADPPKPNTLTPKEIADGWAGKEDATRFGAGKVGNKQL